MYLLLGFYSTRGWRISKLQVTQWSLSADLSIELNYTVKNIWKSYIWTADKDMNESDPRSDMHYLGSSEVMGSNPVQAWIFFTTA